MKKKMLFLFQFLTKVIIILLALSTFFLQKENAADYSDKFFIKWLSLDHFYTSPLNISIFGLMVILIIASIFFKALKKKSQLILHIIIALAFLVMIYDKAFNFRTFMPIMEGQELQLSNIVNNEHYQHTIKLEKFTVEYHDNSRMPSAYTSQFVVDGKDSLTINVNRPGKIGKYHFYQNAYDKIPVYNLVFQDNEYEIAAWDTLNIKDNSIVLNLSENRKSLDFVFNGQHMNISPMGGEFQIEDFNFVLSISGMKYLSIIEVASTRGMRILLLLGLGYLITLGYAFWRKK